MEELIAEVMENLRSENLDSPWVSPGEVATFMFAEGRHSEAVRDWWPDNTLQIAVNSTTGYGGLVWSATQGRSGGGLFDAAGLLCGVLNRCSGTDNDTVPPPWSCSNFATPSTIYRFLDANSLGWLDGVTPKTAAK